MAVVQEGLGSLLLPQQDFLHSQQGVAVGVEVEAVGNDVDDADDDVVSPRHLHSQTMTVTSEGSLTSAKEKTCIKTRNTYLRLQCTSDSHTTYALLSIFFYITHMQVFSLQFMNRISRISLQVMVSHIYLFWTLHTVSVLGCIQYVPMITLQQIPKSDDIVYMTTSHLCCVGWYWRRLLETH